MITSTEVVPGVHRVEKVHDWGWSLSMHVLALRDGGVLVYSPTWCGEGTFEAVDRLGTVRAILAPNHFHHLSLGRFRERYPAARALAAAGARPRLAKKGHADLGDLDELALVVPDGAAAIACEQTRNGEAWLVWPAPGGPALVVGDALFNLERPLRGLRGWVLRRLKTGPGLAFGWTFERFCVADRDGFREWMIATVGELRPRWLIPSHGAPIEDPSLTERITELLVQRLA